MISGMGGGGVGGGGVGDFVITGVGVCGGSTSSRSQTRSKAANWPRELTFLKLKVYDLIDVIATLTRNIPVHSSSCFL